MITCLELAKAFFLQFVTCLQKKWDNISVSENCNSFLFICVLFAIAVFNLDQVRALSCASIYVLYLMTYCTLPHSLSRITVAFRMLGKCWLGMSSQSRGKEHIPTGLSQEAIKELKKKKKKQASAVPFKKKNKTVIQLFSWRHLARSSIWDDAISINTLRTHTNSILWGLSEPVHWSQW